MAGIINKPMVQTKRGWNTRHLFAQLDPKTGLLTNSLRLRPRGEETFVSPQTHKWSKPTRKLLLTAAAVRGAPAAPPLKRHGSFWQDGQKHPGGWVEWEARCWLASLDTRQAAATAYQHLASPAKDTLLNGPKTKSAQTAALRRGDCGGSADASWPVSGLFSFQLESSWAK